MIELTRVRLINWHNFQDECIPFRMVTYMIGVNAVGKTTIMDAIRYCLTTNKDFNAAGNRRSGRTLQGSVHGKQREENRYSRPGHTVAYVGVEFLDHEKMVNFVIAVRVESESPTQELRHVSQDWFITGPGTRLEDLKFLDRDARPTKKDIFKNSRPNIKSPATQKSARQNICRVLGIGDAESSLGKKFNDVFHMGTSLKDIQDIQQFINAYILPEPEIRVEVLQSDMRELECLEETLCEVKDRAELLKTVVEFGIQAENIQRQIDMNWGYILLARSKKFQTEEDEQQAILEAAKQEIDLLKPILQEAKEKVDKAQERLRSAIQAREDDKTFQATTVYRQELEEKSKDYKKQVERYMKWQDSMERLASLRQVCAPLELETVVSLEPGQFLDWTSAKQREVVEVLPGELNKLDSELDEQSFQLRTQNEELNREKVRYAEELRVLRAGGTTVPGQATALLERINTELGNRGMEQDAKIFCELLMMTDESWQNCAEAALGNRRFDIIVPPAHYLAAKAAFSAMGERVGDIALVDTPSLERDSRDWEDPAQNMLASKVNSENYYALKYLQYLLRGLTCCESPDELEKYNRSVTRDLMRHQGYRLQRMKKPILVIGAKARKNRIAFLEERLRQLQKSLKEQEKREKALNGAMQACRSFIYKSHALTIRNNADAQERMKELDNELNAVRQKLREVENNPLLKGLFDRVTNCEEVLRLEEKEENRLQQALWTQELAVKDAQEKILQIMNTTQTAQEEYNAFCLRFPELTEEIETRYAEAAKSRPPADIEKSQQDYRNKVTQKLESHLTNCLIPAQRNYNSKYADYPTGLEGIERYREAYYSLVHIELERAMENLRKAQLRCKERFRKEILFRMKDDILNAKNQFRDLDRVMSELTYGEEKYHFVITDPKDKERLNFCQIIQDKNNVQIFEEDSFFTREAMSQTAYEAQVDELMARIMADINQAALERSQGKKPVSGQISRYVDYRYYLDFDILVENTVTGMKVPLSQVSGDNSGGENQAPFYVAICASLLQIYRQSKNSIRLVMLDEAFNNMTSDRIEPMMRMFRALNMQLVLISTVEKCSAIYPQCDIVYSIIKSGARAVLAPFEKIYEEE